MKTLNLSRSYETMSRLSEKDKLLFRKLLKGEVNAKFKGLKICKDRTLNDLLIMPVSLGSELTCCGFYIEHHQLFRSSLDGRYYLVFFPLKYRKPPFTKKCNYFYYIVAKAHHQDGYYYLLRHNVFKSYCFETGYTLIKHT